MKIEAREVKLKARALRFLCSYQRFHGSLKLTSDEGMLWKCRFRLQSRGRHDKESSANKDEKKKSRIYITHCFTRDREKFRRSRQFIISPRALNSINYSLSNIVIKCTIYKLLSIYINIAHLAAQASCSSSSSPPASCHLRVFLSFYRVVVSVYHWVP